MLKYTFWNKREEPVKGVALKYAYFSADERTVKLLETNDEEVNVTGTRDGIPSRQTKLSSVTDMVLNEIPVVVSVIDVPMMEMLAPVTTAVSTVSFDNADELKISLDLSMIKSLNNTSVKSTDCNTNGW